MNTQPPDRHRNAQDNRRAGGRHPLNIPATLHAATGDPLPVRLIELSVAGVGLLAETAVQVGHEFALTAFDSLVPAGMRVRVVSSREDDTGRFVLGAAVV